MAEPSTTPVAIALQSATDWEGFRHSARALLRHGIAPTQAAWCWPASAPAAGIQTDLFTDGGGQRAPIAAAQLPTWLDRQRGPAHTAQAPAAPRLTARQLQTCQNASLHGDAQRFARLYRWLYRIGRSPALRDDPLDADWHAIARMARAVEREIHKMHAFVRFRPVAQPDGSQHHVAWFEPEHHIVVANAPFFIRRFTNMHWSILSPDACLHWDQRQLHVAPGAQPGDAPTADAGEALWLAYYATTFNPARLKTAAMLREMPRKYWRNLPEARLISPLVGQALQQPWASGD